MSLDDVALNSYTSTSSLKNNALNDQEDEDHRQANVNTSPTGTPKSRKSNGIGLGLPSVLCRSASSSSSQDSLSSSQSKDAEQHSKYHIPSVILRTPGQSLNRTTEPGIISGTRQFFRTCRFPERRLYDIPEHLSPKFNAKTFAFGRSSPRSVPGIIPVASSDFSRTKHVRPSLLEASVKPCLRLKTTSPVGVRDNAGQKVDSLCQRWMNSSQLVTLF
ncbi:hypothetical protein H0H92_008860 [Tricholoma furcatifolium]|nr:hypothetical protein H0H92_008860 [Tricholoma furcatifolium]